MPGVDADRDARPTSGEGSPLDRGAGPGIAEFGAVGVARAFTDVEDFPTGAVRIDVGKVDGVTVPPRPVV